MSCFPICRFVAIALLGLGILLPNCQATDPGELYRSVLLLQLSLADKGQLDDVRDQLLLSELQSEAARGYDADAGILSNSLARLRSLRRSEPEFDLVERAIVSHLDLMQSVTAGDPTTAIANATTDFEPLSTSALESHRLELIDSLERLDAHNEDVLSIYGHHIINKRLGLPGLLAELKSFTIPQVQDTSEIERDFLVKLNQLRQQVRDAKNDFALVSTDYVNFPLYSAELQLADFEQKASYFLLPFAQNANEAFQRNLQRQLEQLRGQNGQDIDLSSREFYAELGRWLNVLDQSDQSSPLLVSARQQFSRPNLHITVSEDFANRYAGEAVFRVDPVDEVILGSRIRGWSQTTGAVNFDFVDHPHNAYVVLTMNGSVVADNYTKEGPITAYTSSYGDLNAQRLLEVNVGGIRVNQAGAYANMVSSFRGVDSIRLIERIAYRQYLKKKRDAERIASSRASEELLEQFTEQTGVALDEPLGQLDDARSRRSEFIQDLNDFRKDYSTLLAENEDGSIDGDISVIDQFEIPRMYVNSTNDHLQVIGTLDGENRLAAPTDPPPNSFPVDVRVQVHESFLSNLSAPLFQNRVYYNWQFPKLVESFLGEMPEGVDVQDEKRWVIRFADGRPIQFEFDENEIGVSIFGTEFRKDQQVFRDPIKISLRMRMVDVDGELKLVRRGKATVQFTEPGQHSAEAIAFRTFLQDNIDAALQGDPMETAIDIPPEMLPKDEIDNEQIQQLFAQTRLVEFRSQDGWLTLGWNYMPPSTEPTVFITDTPSIWAMPARGTPPTPDEGDDDTSDDDDTVDGE